MSRLLLVLAVFWVITLAGCASRINPAFQAAQTAKALPECQNIISAYGVSRPGYVSLAEWAKSRWASDLGRYDKNGDGLIEKSEYVDDDPGVNKPTRSAFEFAFGEWDHGNKGFVTEDDEVRSERAYFDRQDTNHDGWLSVDECARYVPARPCFC